MHASQGSSAAAAHARYTYTPVFLRRRPPPPLLGFRPAEPVFAAFVTPKPLRATSSRLRASEYARVPAARVVSPPSFFDRKDRLYGVELACSPTGSVEEAVDALRFLSRDQGGADSTLPRPPTTGARSHRKRSRGGWSTPIASVSKLRGASGAAAPHTFPDAQPKPLEDMEYRELKNLFAVVFERPTNSNNKEWIFKRLRDRFDERGDPRVCAKRISNQGVRTPPLRNVSNLAASPPAAARDSKKPRLPSAA